MSSTFASCHHVDGKAAALPLTSTQALCARGGALRNNLCDVRALVGCEEAGSSLEALKLQGGVMASAAEERALALIAKAEKKLNGMFSFGNGKYEEAAEMYGQAAKQYQLGKQCESRPLPASSWGSPRNMLTSCVRGGS